MLKKSNFSGSKILECTFNETTLTHSNFSETDLTGTTFHRSDLAGANFSSAINYCIDPVTNNVKKAKFSLPEVAGLLGRFGITIN